MTFTRLGEQMEQRERAAKWREYQIKRNRLIHDLRAEGLPHHQIGRQVGLTSTAVGYVLKKQKPKGAEFTCAHCGVVFVSDWSDAEARAEAEQWGDELDRQGEAVVCDVCYERFMVWARDRNLV